MLDCRELGDDHLTIRAGIKLDYEYSFMKIEQAEYACFSRKRAKDVLVKDIPSEMEPNPDVGVGCSSVCAEPEVCGLSRLNRGVVGLAGEAHRAAVLVDVGLPVV